MMLLFCNEDRKKKERLNSVLQTTRNLKKKVVPLLLAVLMIFGTAVPVAEVMQPMTVSAASTVKLNKTKLTLKKGQTYQLKLNEKNAKITWSSSNKKIVSVSKKGKLTAKKAGKATITAKVGKKKYTCKVTVKNETTTAQTVADKEKAAVLKRINKERKAKGLSALKMNSTLNAAADARAKEIKKQFSHIRPNGSNCFSILKEKKYAVRYIYGGENIAGGYSSAEAVMDAWMNSPMHRGNILEKSYDEVGIGYYYDANSTYGYYWVQLFIGN